MNWTVQCVEYYLYRGVSRTNAYEFMQQSGSNEGEDACTIRKLVTGYCGRDTAFPGTIIQ